MSQPDDRVTAADLAARDAAIRATEARDAAARAVPKSYGSERNPVRTHTDDETTRSVSGAFRPDVEPDARTERAIAAAEAATRARETELNERRDAEWDAFRGEWFPNDEARR